MIFYGISISHFRKRSHLCFPFVQRVENDFSSLLNISVQIDLIQVEILFTQRKIVRESSTNINNIKLGRQPPPLPLPSVLLYINFQINTHLFCYSPFNNTTKLQSF